MAVLKRVEKRERKKISRHKQTRMCFKRVYNVLTTIKTGASDFTTGSRKLYHSAVE